MADNFLAIRRQASNVYLLNFRGGISVVFRPLSWKDYKSLTSLQYYPTFEQTQYGLQDELFLECVLDCNIPDWRNSLDNMLAGIVDAVARAIYIVSGVETTEDMVRSVENNRYSYGLADSQISTVLAITLNINPNEIDNMEWPDILQRLVQSENILAGSIPSAPFTVGSSESKIDFAKDNKEHEKELGKPKDLSKGFDKMYNHPTTHEPPPPPPPQEAGHNIDFSAENDEEFE